MPEITFILLNTPYLNLPNGIIGWISWFALLCLVLFLLYRWRGFNLPWTRKRLIIFFVLLISVPITSLALPGLQLPASQALTFPGLPLEPIDPVSMVLFTVPWMLAGFLLGPSSAVGLAAFSGLLLAAWINYNPYLPLEIALLACIYCVLVNQRYRTRGFRFLRHPLLAALVVALVYPFIYLITSTLLVQGSIANRLDYSLNLLVPTVLVMGISLFVGGVFAEVIYVFIPQVRESEKSTQPSPAERSLEARFLFTVGPISLMLVSILLMANWLVANSAAKKMLREQMANAAYMTSESVPLFHLVGENFIRRFAEDDRLYSQEPEVVRQILEDDMQAIPYFSEFIVLNLNGEPVVVNSPGSVAPFEFSPEELLAIDYALNNVEMLSVSTPPNDSASAARLSFIAALMDDSEQVKGVLIGRTELSPQYPYAQPIVSGLNSLAGIGGEGILINEDGKILYHTDSEQLLLPYTGKITKETSFFDDTSYDGTRQLVYYQPISGPNWSVIITVPAQHAQQQALNIVGPLLIMITAFFLIGVFIIRIGLRFVTVSLHILTVEANRISDGTLDQPLQIKGEDEAGQLGRAFEKMRVNLKSRMDEISQLLSISQGVASSLDFEDSLIPVLEAALATGASSTRVVLEPSVLLDIDEESQSSLSYGAGPASDLYHYLDEQILSLTKRQDRILLTNLSRPRLLRFSPGFPRPQALIAVALQHENMFYGTFWVGYDQPHHFEEEEQRYLDTLAGLASLAVANAHLFQSAKVGRQRLEAIVASTPDPVLVTDYHNNLLLANPAAVQAFGNGIKGGRGKIIDEVITDETLIRLLQSSKEKIQSAELILPDENVYLATSSSVVLEGKRMGRVCVLRDVTQFKKLDALKSEFVSTVSHDLRSPLTLIRGYATMLQMVGELNEQQTGYVHKIIASVESMSRLVSNLLDLGRIEAGVGLQLEMVPVHSILETVVSGLQLQAAQKRIQMNLVIPEYSIPLIEADQALLQQALQNLVENAIKYTDAGGKVEVSLHPQQEKIVIEVRDTGIGIAPADQQRLFEKFYRAVKRGAQRDRGTGLGLTIVKSIAERHGGRVWLESQLGRGSIFYLEIPVSQADQVQKNVL